MFFIYPLVLFLRHLHDFSVLLIRWNEDRCFFLFAIALYSFLLLLFFFHFFYFFLLLPFVCFVVCPLRFTCWLWLSVSIANIKLPSVGVVVIVAVAIAIAFMWFIIWRSFVFAFESRIDNTFMLAADCLLSIHRLNIAFTLTLQRKRMYVYVYNYAHRALACVHTYLHTPNTTNGWAQYGTASM